MQQRVMGVENEYALALTQGSRNLDPATACTELFRQLAHLGPGNNHFLSNGARLYLDVGHHPEYATPECDNLRELLAHEAAGDLWMAQMGAAAESSMRARGLPVQVHVVKNNTDDTGNTFGSHENYLTARHLEPARIISVLATHLATRILYTGAGCVSADPARFVISERARHITAPLGEGATRNRPLLSVRDEPHADAGRYRRLHVVCGEATLTHRATALRLGTTHLVLRLLEERARSQRSLTLARPVAALQRIRSDLSLREPLELISGRAATALTIQRMLHERCASLVGADPTPGEAEVLTWWDDTLTALEAARTTRGPDAALAAAAGPLGTQLDWPVKLRLLQAWRERAGVGWEDGRLRRLDLAYHELHATRGLGATLRRHGQVEELVAAHDIDAARRHPPATTRAALRGALCDAARSAGAEFGVSWDRFALTSLGGKQLPTPLDLRAPDPFAPTSEEGERILALLAAPREDAGGS